MDWIYLNAAPGSQLVALNPQVAWRDQDALTVRDCNVDNGPIQKTWMPRSMGRANRIQHRTSHVTVTVAS